MNEFSRVIVPPLGSSATILTALDFWADLQPDEPLYTFLDRDGSTLDAHGYAGFRARVDAIAQHLLQGPADYGDRVLLAYQPGLEIIAALFACAKVGLIGVPTAPLSSHDLQAWLFRIDHVSSDSGAALVLMCTETRDILDKALARNTDAVAREMAERFLEIPSLVTTELAALDTSPAMSRPNPVVFIQYTSGSTSEPKGVAVTHANLLANCAQVVDHPKPVAVTWLPQHHDMGLIGYYIFIALTGGRTYGFSPKTFIQRPMLWLETISKHGATASSVPNFALELCLHERRVPTEELRRFDLSSLRFLMAAAEPISADVFSAFLRKFRPCGLNPEGFFVAYGLAEFTLAVTNYGRDFLTVDRRHLAQGAVRTVERTGGVANAVRLMSCGRALGDTDIRIIDPDRHEPVGEDRTGEVWIAGAARSDGYWNRPEQSSETFEARIFGDTQTRPYLRTGDIGFLHGGELYICGRIKDLIIVRGQNIYPQDIETVVQDASPLIRRNCVAAFSGDLGAEGDITVVAEVARLAEIPEEAEIVRAVRDALQIPIARVVFVAPHSVAKTSSGKIRRAQTRTLLNTGALTIVRDARQSAIPVGEGQTTDIYELEVLKERYSLTGNEDFTLFDAGIDSLDLVIFLNWLKDSLADQGADDLSDRVSARLLGAISIRQMFQIAGLFAKDPATATEQIGQFLDSAYQTRLAEERQLMQADRAYAAPAEGAATGTPTTDDVLITGGSGFLGPFLLESLLRQTTHRLRVLVRGSSDAHAMDRLRKAYRENIHDPSARTAFEERVEVMCGDLEAPRFGLAPGMWERLREEIATIYHNGAIVNYLLDYKHMRGANVEGTSTILDLAMTGRRKVFNHISTTFIFGWATKDVLYETDRNEGMDHLDFGYSQSKWASEQAVFSAMQQGLDARVFRPALITPGLDGGGGNLDITIRLLSFMIKHAIGVNAKNQVSFMPADITANNIVAIAGQPDTLGGSFHVVRDSYETMPEITGLLGRKAGIVFDQFELPDFVPEVIRRCTRNDLLYPLLDFLVGSVDEISAMEFKLYESSSYKAARDASVHGRDDPPLDAVIDGILSFLRQRQIL